MKKQSKIKPGDIILVNSFCECKVKIKISRLSECGWWGYVYDPKDRRCLREYEVNITDRDETYAFHFHFIKIIRKS